ncbi:site-specific integrase [Hydrogenophaga sp.]|uniref:tyrosine-type recombinase/integrase n=2 Tax=unclassified Hydrogenophaga TaxID=2610897 RepID=UPI001AD3EC8B|nr:site-specific integrase [Hydrogenophaga sp.]MBN9370968.1 integrase arm-type DNA-binding domain-containing protein [Hydrogenophaga sp.]
MPKKAKELGALEVKRLTEPGLHFVGGIAGLGLQVSPSGAKSWVLRAVIGNKRRKMGLGGFPDVPLARARLLAIEARDQIRNGVDPIDQKKARRRDLAASRAMDVTFRRCAEDYIASHRGSWKNEKHEAQWSSTLENYAYPVIGDLWVRDVTKAHVLSILKPIWHTKTETASRLRGRIEAVLDSATTMDLRTGLNPARWKGNLSTLLPAARKIAKSTHFKAVPVPELPAFFQRLQAQEGVSARALEFLILTNVRSHNVRHASWSEIDLKTKTWLIPGEDAEGSKQRMKAGVSHRVPLSPAALKLLEKVGKTAGTDLIFPSPRKLAPLSDMALSKLMKDMEANGVPHGFRSTFRDWTVERTSFPREVTERAMAHAVGDKTEAAYLRSDVFEKRRRLMDMWATYCTTKPQKEGKVILIR